MTDLQGWNQKVINEFRANRGVLTGPMRNAPLLLLHHRGRVSGIERVTPLIYQKVGDAYAVFASASGAAADPDWYRNLLAHPVTTIEVGPDTVTVTVRNLDASERDPIWQRQKQLQPNYADYERRTSRVIPVVLLKPTG